MTRGRSAVRGGYRAVPPVIASILLVRVAAGAVLWSFRVSNPAAGVVVIYVAQSAGRSPVYGDPSDCQPYGDFVPFSTAWYVAFDRQCITDLDGNYSQMNATAISFTSHSPQNIPFDRLDLTFICNGSTALVSGSLAAVTWFPGVSHGPAPNAPTLGWCGTFNASGYGHGAFSTLYKRLGIFIPISQSATVLPDGDTFLLDIHTPGSVYDSFAQDPDTDDFHGAPSWCLTTPDACTIYLTQTETLHTLLETSPLLDISGAGT